MYMHFTCQSTPAYTLQLKIFWPFLLGFIDILGKIALVSIKDNLTKTQVLN